MCLLPILSLSLLFSLQLLLSHFIFLSTSFSLSSFSLTLFHSFLPFLFCNLLSLFSLSNSCFSLLFPSFLSLSLSLSRALSYSLVSIELSVCLSPHHFNFSFCRFLSISILKDESFRSFIRRFHKHMAIGTFRYLVR